MGHANDIASLADDAVKALGDLVLEIVKALREHLTLMLGEGRTLDAELAAKLEADFGLILRELDYDAGLERVVTTFEDVLKANEVHLADTLGASFSTVGRESLGAFVNGVVDQLVRFEGEAGAALKDAVLRGGVAALPVEDQIDALAKAAKLKLNEAVTEVDTSVMAFHREALVTTAEEAGIDLFTYDGPLDEVTRPFCEEHLFAPGVGRIYTARDLDQETNGQNLWPTSRFLGGFWCRHSLSPLTREQGVKLVGEFGERIVGGPEARRILLGGRQGPNEQTWVAENTGAVVTRAGKASVVRRRRAA